MTLRLDTISEDSLQFFSKLSASLSHDFKNALAIINENSGLMNDFALMAQQGVPIDPQRLIGLAAMISKQVGRANANAKNLSRLAHSLDKPASVVDLNETLQLLTKLTERLFQLRNATMDVNESSHTVEVETYPFFLMTLLWRLLDRATTTGKVTSITVAAENRDDGARIVLQLEGDTRKLPKIFETEQIDGFLNLLNAELIPASGNKKISLNLPARLDTVDTAMTADVSDPDENSPAVSKVSIVDDEPDETNQQVPKVLIVDDEDDFLTIMVQRLGERGIDVAVTTSPENALEMIEQESFDVLIIDFLMPGMDGFKMLKALKIHMPDVKVFLHTGYIPEVQQAEALKLGALDVIEKPADLDLLTRMIFNVKKQKN